LFTALDGSHLPIQVGRAVIVATQQHRSERA